MKTFTVIRKDFYFLEVEAKDEDEARDKVESEDYYLSGGSYDGSEFIIEED